MLLEYGEELLEYIEEHPTKSRAKAKHVEDGIGLNSFRVPYLMEEINELLEEEIEAEMGDPTRYKIDVIRENIDEVWKEIRRRELKNNY